MLDYLTEDQKDYLSSLMLRLNHTYKYRKIIKPAMIEDPNSYSLLFMYTLNSREYIIEIDKEVSGEDLYSSIINKIDIRLMMVDS